MKIKALKWYVTNDEHGKTKKHSAECIIETNQGLFMGFGDTKPLALQRCIRGMYEHMAALKGEIE